MYRDLWENDPDIKKIREESEARGIARGMAKAVTQRLQRSVIIVVNARFPDLMELAQQTVPLVDNPETLDTWLKHVAAASDEDMVRRLLSSSRDPEE